MIAKSCEACGRAFEAQRHTAKFCSSNCRQRAHQAAKAGDPIVPNLPRRREGAAVVGLAPPPVPEDADGYAARTRRRLEAAGRLDTYQGDAAMYLARVADAMSGDTGSGHASLMKQYMATMAEALDGAVAAETPLEKIRRERDLMAG